MHRNYLCGVFWLDFLSSLPLDELYRVFLESNCEAHHWDFGISMAVFHVKFLMKCLRLGSVRRMMRGWEDLMKVSTRLHFGKENLPRQTIPELQAEQREGGDYRAGAADRTDRPALRVCLQSHRLECFLCKLRAAIDWTQTDFLEIALRFSTASLRMIGARA